MTTSKTSPHRPPKLSLSTPPPHPPPTSKPPRPPGRSFSDNLPLPSRSRTSSYNSSSSKSPPRSSVSNSAMEIYGGSRRGSDPVPEEDVERLEEDGKLKGKNSFSKSTSEVQSFEMEVRTPVSLPRRVEQAEILTDQLPSRGSLLSELVVDAKQFPSPPLPQSHRFLIPFKITPPALLSLSLHQQHRTSQIQPRRRLPNHSPSLADQRKGQIEGSQGDRSSLLGRLPLLGRRVLLPLQEISCEDEQQRLPLVLELWTSLSTDRRSVETTSSSSSATSVEAALLLPQSQEVIECQGGAYNPTDGGSSNASVSREEGRRNRNGWVVARASRCQFELEDGLVSDNESGFGRG